MTKVDFRKIEVENIEGGVDIADVSKELGNQMYMRGSDIEECEMGREIWKKGEVELNEKQIALVRKHIAGWFYILRSAVEKKIKTE